MDRTFSSFWRYKKLLVVIILGVLIYYAASSLFPLQIYSYAKTVPVSIGRGEGVTTYWIVSAVLNERVEFKMVLPKNESIREGNEETVALKEVGILFTPKAPDSQAILTVGDYYFLTKYTMPPGLAKEKAPVYNVEPASWLTTAHYDAEVYRDGVKFMTYTKHVDVNFQRPHVVYLSTPLGDVTINNLGLIPQGVEVPSGDLVVVLDPYGQKHLWSKADFLNFLEWWNTGYVTIWSSALGYTWTDVWVKAKESNRLPKDILLPYVSKVLYNADMSKLTLVYSGMVFAADVSCYIPDSIAQTVIIQLDKPVPKIVDVTPKQFSVKEGTKTQVSVTVENTGTEGVISVALLTDKFAVVPLTETYRFFQPNEKFVFRFELTALNVMKTETTSIKVSAQGRGGEASSLITATIEDVEGYTPPTPEVNTLLEVVVLSSEKDYAPVEGVVVDVQAGDRRFLELTNSAGVAEFDLGKFTGPVKVKVEGQEKTVNVQVGLNRVVFFLNQPFNWMLWVVVGSVAGLSIITITYLWRRKHGS